MTEQEKADYEFVNKYWANGLDRDSGGIFFFIGDAGINFDTWSAAREFTENRLEEIRQIKAEIWRLNRVTYTEGEFLYFINDAVSGAFIKYPDYVAHKTREYCRDCRIFDRLEAALAELKRGMK